MKTRSKEHIRSETFRCQHTTMSWTKLETVSIQRRLGKKGDENISLENASKAQPRMIFFLKLQSITLKIAHKSLTKYWVTESLRELYFLDGTIYGLVDVAFTLLRLIDTTSENWFNVWIFHILSHNVFSCATGWETTKSFVGSFVSSHDESWDRCEHCFASLIHKICSLCCCIESNSLLSSPERSLRFDTQCDSQECWDMMAKKKSLGFSARR